MKIKTLIASASAAMVWASAVAADFDKVEIEALEAALAAADFEAAVGILQSAGYNNIKIEIDGQSGEVEAKSDADHTEVEFTFDVLTGEIGEIEEQNYGGIVVDKVVIEDDSDENEYDSSGGPNDDENDESDDETDDDESDDSDEHDSDESDDSDDDSEEAEESSHDD